MWIVNAVGSVNGQTEFSFVLEQERSYVVGRDKAADIRFADRSVRPKEGVLEVGDWDPANFRTPPRLIYRVEAKKNGSFPPLKALSQRTGFTATYRRDDYDVEELDGGEVYEFQSGNGLDIASGVCIYAQWMDMRIAYEKFRSEPDDLMAVLRKHCVSWCSRTDADTDIVISEDLNTANSTSFAVCYGIPVVTPAWLQMLKHRIKVCWKKNADSEDSFHVPPIDDPDFVPKIKEGIPGHRADPGAWRIAPTNRTLFSKFIVIGAVGSKKNMKESPYVKAMGAKYQEVDVVSRPLVSGNDFLERIAPIRAEAEADGRDAMIVYYPSLKKELQEKNIVFESVIIGACESAGLYAAGFGPLVWGVVKHNGVKEYFESKLQEARQQSAAQSAPPEPAGGEAAPAAPEPTPAQNGSKRLVRRGGTTSRSVSRAPSQQPDVVPSTYPEVDTMAAPPKDAPPPAERAASPPKTTIRKPLRRRAGRAKVDLDDDLDMEDVTPDPSQGGSSMVPDTQFSSGGGTQHVSDERGAESRVPDSMQVDTQSSSMMPPSTAHGGPRSKLKRRAGVGATQSSFLDGFDTTVQYEEEVKKQQKAREIRDLYEETKRETMSLSVPQSKRQRTQAPPVESIDELMEVDEDDFVAKNMRAARLKREPISPAKRAAPPSAQPAPEPAREESPESIDLVPAKKTKAVSKAATKSTQQTQVDVNRPPSQVDKDEAFLQAIKTSRKKGMDDLDREFNALRIPKDQQKWEDDYTIVKDFTDDLRGNFIEIVHKDLFRKDPPRISVPLADDGRPNFKKFKKKNVQRREPMQLTLSVSNNAAEMGEPYWDTEEVGTQRGGTQKKTQSQTKSQSQRMAILDEEDEAPLLPRSKRRLLSQIQEEEDDFAPVATTRRRGITPLTQSQPDPPTRRGRNARSGSAMSDRSSASSTPAPPPATKPPTRARRGTQASRAVVIDDDSDDEPVFATARSTSRSTARTRPTRASGAVSGTAQPSGTATLDFDDEVPSSARATAGSSRVSGRRKLLVEDDGDDVVFQGVSKKRRLG